VFPKSKIFKFLKRDCGTIPVAEIINGKIEIFSKHQRFLIATESSKYLLIFVLYVCVILMININDYKYCSNFTFQTFFFISFIHCITFFIKIFRDLFSMDIYYFVYCISYM
jgi:hypothetical protein